MQFVALLIAVALAVKFWWLIVGGVGLVVAGYWGPRAVDRHVERVDAKRRRVAELVDRADQQHNWVMQVTRAGYTANIPLSQFDSVLITSVILSLVGCIGNCFDAVLTLIVLGETGNERQWLGRY